MKHNNEFNLESHIIKHSTRSMSLVKLKHTQVKLIWRRYLSIARASHKLLEILLWVNPFN